MTIPIPKGLRAALAVALACVALAPAGAAAQDREVANLKRATGNVLVSRPEGLGTGTQGQRLVQGARILTTANSEAVIQFDNGCEVHMKENERFEVDATRACALLVAQPLGVAVAAVGAPLAGYILPIVTGIILLDPNVRQSISPN